MQPATQDIHPRNLTSQRGLYWSMENGAAGAPQYTSGRIQAGCGDYSKDTRRLWRLLKRYTLVSAGWDRGCRPRRTVESTVPSRTGRKKLEHVISGLLTACCPGHAKQTNWPLCHEAPRAKHAHAPVGPAPGEWPFEC